MKILYVSQYFPPEMGAPAARVSELSLHWVRANHQVTVLTGFPNHPTGVVLPEYRSRFRRLVSREQLGGVNVVRTWLLPLPNRKPLERVLNYASFFFSSCLTGSMLARPDVVIGTSPQLLVGLTAWWLSRVKRVPFILEIRDLWPESIFASGIGGKQSLLYSTLQKLAAFLYRTSDHIVVVTPAFKRELVSQWKVNPEKISVVQNGVETDLFAPESDGTDWKSDLVLLGKFVVSFIGTIGAAHGLGVVLEAAARLEQTEPNIVFLFVGEGAEKDRLIQAARERKLGNVRFISQQPREKIAAVIRASDVCLVVLRKADIFQTVIPTKMLEFLSCGRPVILGVDGQARELLEEARAGIYVEPENTTVLVSAIKQLYNNHELRQTLGRNGRQYAVNKLSRKRTAKEYSALLEWVVKSIKR